VDPVDTATLGSGLGFFRRALGLGSAFRRVLGLVFFRRVSTA